MHPHAPLAFTAATVIQSTPTELNGLGPFRFGMTIDEIKQIAPVLSDSVLNGEGGLSSAASLRFSEVESKYALWITHDRLSGISASQETVGNDVECERHFTTVMYDLIRAYGAGDGHPRITTDNIETHRDYWSRYDNDTYVQFEVWTDDGKCRTLLALSKNTNKL